MIPIDDDAVTDLLTGYELAFVGSGAPELALLPEPWRPIAFGPDEATRTRTALTLWNPELIALLPRFWGMLTGRLVDVRAAVAGGYPVLVYVARTNGDEPIAWVGIDPRTLGNGVGSCYQAGAGRHAAGGTNSGKPPVPRLGVADTPLEGLQVAEKPRAYTRIYADAQPSSRTKDLVDLVLISELANLDAISLLRAMQETVRGTHPLPEASPPPPRTLVAPFGELARPVGSPPTWPLSLNGTVALADDLLGRAGLMRRRPVQVPAGSWPVRRRETA